MRDGKRFVAGVKRFVTDLEASWMIPKAACEIPEDSPGIPAPDREILRDGCEIPGDWRKIPRAAPVIPDPSRMIV